MVLDFDDAVQPLYVAAPSVVAAPGPMSTSDDDPLRTMRATLAAAVGRLMDDDRVHCGIPLQAIPPADEAPWPTTVMSPPDYARVIAEKVIRHSINMGSPRCLAHMSGTVSNVLRPVVETVMALNQNMVKCDASRALSQTERKTLAMLHQLVFADAETPQRPLRGVFTSGSSLANITALWCARNRMLGADAGVLGVERHGLADTLVARGIQRPVIIGSAAMHYAIDKAADLLGIGSAQVIRVDVDDRHRLDVDALCDAVSDCRRRRWKPIALVGIAGTADSGSIDPLEDMSRIAKQEGIPFHVDAAWGTPLLFSDLHRPLLRAIEMADSVTLDFHKQLSLPIGLAAVLFRDPRHAQSIAGEAPSMLHEDSDDLGKHSLEGSRNGMSLVAHAALHLIGQAGFASLIDDHIARAALFARMIEQHGEFELLLRPQTNIVLYRWLPPPLRRQPHRRIAAANERINHFNTALQTQQYEAGNSHVSRTTVRQLPAYRGLPVVALRAVIANPRTTENDLRAVLDEQCQLAASLEPANAPSATKTAKRP